MSFQSTTATSIWEDLYNVYVPDFVTLNKDHIRKFGVPSSGNKEVDKMMSSNLTFVKIPIIKILEYYDNGVGVQIPERKDMIAIHKTIEKYLEEWREHIRYDINLNRMEYKPLLTGLEKLSKLIFEKAYPKEVVDALIAPKQFGLVNAFAQLKEDKREVVKPDYNGISSLLKPAIRDGRYGR